MRSGGGGGDGAAAGGAAAGAVRRGGPGPCRPGRRRSRRRRGTRCTSRPRPPQHKNIRTAEIRQSVLAFRLNGVGTVKGLICAEWGRWRQPRTDRRDQADGRHASLNGQKKWEGMCVARHRWDVAGPHSTRSKSPGQEAMRTAYPCPLRHVLGSEVLLRDGCEGCGKR